MLELRHISKTFNPGTINEVRSLREVSLSIEDGSFVTVIGTNGSGKSTLLNAVAGTFFIDSDRRASLIGRVFPNPFSGTAPNMSIAENLALAARRGRSRGFGPALGHGWMRELHERVRVLHMGLESRLANAIGTLSGGERQALTLLMATWLRPEILLLDEHTAALDPKSGDKVIRVSEEIIARDKLTALMVTHSMSQAATLGDRLIMMHRGRIIYDVRGAEKHRLRPADLLARFEEVRRGEQLDETAADMLKRAYI